MTSKSHVVHQPRHEHTVPWFWPIAAAIELGQDGMTLSELIRQAVARVHALAGTAAAREGIGAFNERRRPDYTQTG